jgi:WD40 repeat protein
MRIQALELVSCPLSDPVTSVSFQAGGSAQLFTCSASGGASLWHFEKLWTRHSLKEHPLQLDGCVPTCHDWSDKVGPGDILLTPSSTDAVVILWLVEELFAIHVDLNH